VFCIQRDVTEIVTGKFRSETVYGLTSLTPEKASPDRLLSFNPNHWSIENRGSSAKSVGIKRDIAGKELRKLLRSKFEKHTWGAAPDPGIFGGMASRLESCIGLLRQK
jgi:hypothetical protein